MWNKSNEYHCLLKQIEANVRRETQFGEEHIDGLVDERLELGMFGSQVEQNFLKFVAYV